jgi:putative membrane protein
MSESGFTPWKTRRVFSKMQSMKNNTITPLSAVLLALFYMLLPGPPAEAADEDTLNAFDMRFIKRAASYDMTEVSLAKLGAQKAVRPEVKAYAAMLVTDHSKVGDELSNLAAAKGVKISNSIGSKQAATFQKLEQSSAAEFDAHFLAEMVKAHQMCMSNFEEASRQARDPEVKALANKMLPTLKAHLQKAMELSPKDMAIVKTEPDNTARNVLDRDGKKLTPFDQGSSKNDTEITAQIRKEIIAAKNMSVNAQNVKIVTLNGRVTLRGPVNSAEEKRLIAEMASRFVRAGHVDCQLEVK